MTIIDFEFTGLDNSYIKDNEIIQLKFLDTVSGQSLIRNYQSKKRSTAGAYLCHRLQHKTDGELFSIEEFEKALLEFNNISGLSINNFMGFGVSQDKLMLSKYGISLEIQDLQEWMMLTDKYELLMATDGKSLEVCYYLASGVCAEINDHSGISELCLISQILHYVQDLPSRGCLNYMPYGHCAGMPISQYIEDYRRAADGYRFNNNDLLARSINYAIMEKENDYMDDDDIGAHMDTGEV